MPSVMEASAALKTSPRTTLARSPNNDSSKAYPLDDPFELMQHITRDDGSLNRQLLLFLWESPVLLFRLAHILQRRASGDEVSFVVNRNINFTNVCVGSCRFCAFHQDGGFRLTDQEILDRVEEASRLGATEICIQGGLAPGMVVEDYCEILALIKGNYTGIHLHAYSPMEVLHMSRNSGVDVVDSIAALKASGLGSMPGTAAEILVDSVRKRICPSKLSTAKWCDVIRTAHLLGVPSTSTMLYGHLEGFEDRVRHLEVLRGIQSKTRGFTEFVLLPFVSANTPLGDVVRPMDLLAKLKMHALSRVALYPLITNIQTSWVKLGREAAGSAIEWGANDLGGTLLEENISRTAGGTEGQYLSADEMRAIISRHGRRAVQRDTLYQRLRTFI